MLCCVVLCYVMFWYVMLCSAMLCYVMLCYVMLCYVMLCYIMLWYVLLYYVLLCYGFGSTISNSYLMGNDYYQSLEKIRSNSENNIISLGIGERCIINNTIVDKNCRIGNDVKLYQGVTLGALNVSKEHAAVKRHPTIQDGVIIYSGATILGGSTIIGRKSIIGGNVWLTYSVPDHSNDPDLSSSGLSRGPMDRLTPLPVVATVKRCFGPHRANAATRLAPNWVLATSPRMTLVGTN